MNPVAVILIVWTILSVPAASAAEKDRLAPVRATIENYIRPQMSLFAESSARLELRTGQLCDDPSVSTLSDARLAFSSSITQFAHIEMIRPGPLSKDNQAERLLFWPDRKSTGRRQVLSALKNQDPDVINPDLLAEKSVALQGFMALEYLLYGKDSQQLLHATGSFRCRFARSVATNINAIAQNIDDDWQDRDGFSAEWLDPGPQNARYRDSNESLSELIAILAHGLERIRDQRLKPIIGGNGRNANPRRALFWRSGNAMAMIEADLTGLAKLVKEAGLGVLLPPGSYRLSDAIDFEMNNALGTSRSLVGPVAQLVDEQAAIARLNYLIIVTSSLQDLIGVQYAYEVGLPTGFSPLDGD